MADIKPFLLNHLLEPLKQYPTVIQDTMIEIIAQKLQRLYDYTIQFPEIVSPNQSRMDILQAIADQFLFTVREDADIQEQVDILNNILYVYNKRGSIDTIENMWKYYGGDLPKDVKVIIPSYNLFRYSISKLSGTHVFQDNNINRTGVYEIRLTNNTYPIPDLKEFLLKELVAAGNYIYFTNTLHLDVTSEKEDSSYYKYLVSTENLIDIQLSILKSHQGFTWSGLNPLSRNSEDSAWSGRGSIFLELTKILDMNLIDLSTYTPYGSLGIIINILPNISEVVYSTFISKRDTLYRNEFLYCTPADSLLLITRYLYNSHGEVINSDYPGYFILGKSLLGEEVI